MDTCGQHAGGRTTLIVTLATAGAHRFGKQDDPPIARAIMETLQRERPGRYDLLTVPDDAAGNDTAQARMLSEHIVSAANRHGIRRVIVALAKSSQHLADELTKLVAIPDMVFFAVDLGRFGCYDLPLPEHLTVACMDWRMHGSDGGLLAALECAYGPGAYSLLTMAGGAKWAADPSSQRGAYLINYLAQAVHNSTPLTQIHLTIHMDCGGYGGDEAFPSFDEQLARLTTDLRAAFANVERAVAKARWGARVTAGIVELNDGRVSRIIKI